MDFDYYQIKGKWNAATVTRRAEKLEEAEAAADELEAAGADGVEIVGVKAGKREKIRGKRNPAKKKITEKTRAKKKMTAKRAKTSVKTKGTTGDYITDFKTEKKAKAAAENIRALGFETEIIEPRGQLDLFNDVDKKNIWSFNNREITYIKKALYEKFETGRSSYGLKKLLTNFEKLNARQKIELSNSEITKIYDSLLDYRYKHNVGATGTTFFEISRLMESLKKGV